MFLSRDKEYIPASIRVSLEESPFWGRITAINPDGAELLSQFEFKKGKMLALGFELDGEKLEDIRVAVSRALRDSCGYYHYSVALADRDQRKALMAILIRLIAKN
jgi:uncharacterized tellurite resistance protein B-like protein